MTLFSAMDVLSYEHACAVWDLFFVDGWKALFRVSLAMLAAVEDVLVTSDFGTIVRFLNTYPRHRVPDVSTLIANAMRFKVTNKYVRRWVVMCAEMCVCASVCVRMCLCMWGCIFVRT